ncbi:MAG: SDR family NAD(P)-dependent oxidoreductase [Dehalococcoidia bacterium]
MYDELSKKSVLITGGGLGIGQATARAFAAEGSNVTIFDIDKIAGEKTAEEIKKSGGSAIFFHGDASKSQDCLGAVNMAINKYKSLSILFNNVAIQPPDSYLNAVELPEEMWDKIININLKSRYLMAKFSIPHMKKLGQGVIISVASVQGLQSMPLVPAYAASKGGDLSLMRQMSLDFASDNIRFASINPGTIETPMVLNALEGTGENIEDGLINSAAAHPLGRNGKPEEIAKMALFLSSDNAQFITGSHFNVDGGMMAKGAWANSVGASGSN